jgi:imidazolonepropionase
MLRPRASLVIRDCGELLTLAPGPLPRRGPWLRELGLIKRGAVAAAGERIVWVGPESRVDREVDCAAATMVEARGRVVMPALVDPHVHPVFAGNRAQEFAARLEGQSYQESAAGGGGILASVRATRSATLDELIHLTRSRILEMIAHGTTTLEVKSGYGLNLEDELKSLQVIRSLSEGGLPARLVPTFLGAHAVPPEYPSEVEYIDFLCRAVLPVVARQGLASYCDCFLEDGYFGHHSTRALFRAARNLGLGLRLHADEFRDGGGAALAVAEGAASADHLLAVGPAGIAALAASETVAVLMPGTPLTLRLGKFAPAREMINAGVAVALGSDFNPGTCLISSMQAVVSLASLEMGLTPAESICAATVNAAVSLGLGDTVGRLVPGLAADCLLLDAETYRELPFRLGGNAVAAVIHNGQVVAPAWAEKRPAGRNGAG